MSGSSRHLSRGNRHPRVLALVLPIVFAVLASPAVAQLPDAVVSRIDRFVERSMEEHGLVPGLSLAIVRGGEIVYANGFGWADVGRREAATAETIYYLASLSKAQTGMAAAVLADEGGLDLDDPITRFFPELEFSPPLAPADSTTVRDLLTHTPRFANSGVNFYSSFVDRYGEADLIRVLSGYSDPSEGFNYANTNYALASEILARAAGEPWRDVLASRVFEPVGMTSTTAYASRLPIRGVATPYIRTTRGFEAQPPLKTDDKITGAGGFFSNVRDLARYVLANLGEGRIDGRQVLPRGAVQEVMRPQADVSTRFFEFDRRAYGLGLYVADYDGDTLVHHFGGIPGGFLSHMSFMPEHDIGVVALQNVAAPAGAFPHIVATYVYDLLIGRSDVEERARRRLDEMTADSGDQIREITARADRIDSVRAAAHAPALSREAYRGTYMNERLGRVRVVPGSDGLRVQWGEIDAPLVPLGGNDFLIQWQPDYAPVTWRFRVSGDRIEGFDWGGRPFPRVDEGLRR